MPLPRRLATFNRVVTNRVLGPFARYVPGFAVVSHVGRRSGRTYRTPVSLFSREMVRDPARSLVPKPLRVPLRLANVEEFMLLRRAPPTSDNLGASEVP